MTDAADSASETRIETGIASGTEPGRDDESRILTVPNVITFVRLACLPLYLVILLGQDKRFAAALLLGALGATDWVDGYIARHFHQVSTLGKVLDPVADRLLFFVGIAGILLVDPPGAPVWFCWMVDRAGGLRLGGHARAGRDGGQAHRRHLVRQGRARSR